jgi:hypothetical protein
MTTSNLTLRLPYVSTEVTADPCEQIIAEALSILRGAKSISAVRKA